MTTTNLKDTDVNNTNQTLQQTMASGDSTQIANQTNQMMNMGYNPMMNMGYNPMMGMGYNPNGPMPAMMMGYGPQNYMYVEDPMKELTKSTGAIINQEVDMIEYISGCETQNKYRVFIQSPMGLKFCFKCNERSGCCARCCCSNDCRSLELVIRHVSPHEVDTDISKIYLRANKSCSFCCLCRSTLDVKKVDDDNNKNLGKVREPFTCCDKDAEIYNEQGNLKYKIIGDCCQVGLCCGSSAEKMAEIEFKITQGNEVVGMMKKMMATVGEYYTKSDSYKISFPPKATPEEKMLIICACLLIDYQNFENDKTPKNNKKQRQN